MGLLDGITGQNGLFGLGGIGGLNQANTAQLQPLLGGMYNPQDLQHIQLKNMLLGAGLGLLQQKPSIAPITFGSTLGDGLAGGLQQAQAATDSYRQNALTAYGLKRQQMMDQIPMNQEARAAQMFPDQLAQANLGLQSAQQQAAALNGLSPMQRLNPQYASELAQGPKTEYGPIGMNTFGQPIMGWRQPPPPNQNTGAPGQVSQVDTSPKPMNTFLPPQTTVQPPSAPNSPATATNPDVVGTGKAAYNPVAFNALPPEAKNDVVAIGRKIGRAHV